LRKWFYIMSGGVSEQEQVFEPDHFFSLPNNKEKSGLVM